MDGGKLYLAEVTWRARGTVANVSPSMSAVPVSLALDEGSYEASIPAYSRENGRDVQLAVKSLGPCSIVISDGETVDLAEYIDPDTGEHWWIEKGAWRSIGSGGFHDAPSFRHPGGQVELLVAGTHCTVHVFYPGLTEADFSLLLDDLRTWCWRMAVDEACYVAVDQEAEVKVLAPDFITFASNFLRHAHSVLDLPNSELREAVEYQKIQRLRPNIESLRFLAQRGAQPMVPGRSATPHYGTPENRFVHGMIRAVMRMLRPQEILARGSSSRFLATATRYETRAKELREQTTERIDPAVIDETLRRIREKRTELKNAMTEDLKVLRVNQEHGDHPGSSLPGWLGDTWVLVELGFDENSSKIRSFVQKHGSAMILGLLVVTDAQNRNGKRYKKCEIRDVQYLGVWRNYRAECTSLETKRRALEMSNWEQTIPKDVLAERKKEARTLTERAETLRNAADRTRIDEEAVAALFSKASGADKRAKALGIMPDIRFVPTMVFLQSPAYAGALSAYRQLLGLTGIDESILDGLLALEKIGICDWPAVYERWCLVALLRVLQDEFHFVFDKKDVQKNLLTHCTAQSTGFFEVGATRADMNLSLRLSYQPELPNGRRPDFILVITDNELHTTSSMVLDAKSCNFVRRPENTRDARRNIFRYLDDCLHELVIEKNYGQEGGNRVFVMHPTRDACITYQTTMQSWAKNSAYGGDSVFFWEDVPPVHMHGAVFINPSDMSNLKRLILMIIQFDLERNDICASCCAGGQDVAVKVSETRGGNPRYECTCKKCHFLSLRSVCHNCKKPIVKNAAWWSYHDLHPTDVWNIKCPACGSLL
jgi:pyrethroid hydrolase